MKNYLSILISFCLLFSFAACSPSAVDKPDTENPGTEDPGSKDPSVEDPKIDEKYIPQFMDIEEGKESLKSVIFWTIGWMVQYADPYLFAIAGRYIVRYNSDNNTVDKIINLGESPKGGAALFSTSSEGRYLINYVFYHHEVPFTNYFLLDCEDETAELLAEVYDETKVDKIRDEKIPEEVKNEFNDSMFFSSGYPDTGIRIDGKSYPKDGFDFVYAFMKSKNITCIGSTSSIENFIITDENTIVGIMPTDPDESGKLGYYKFIKIDVEQDKIVQECILN